VWNSVTLAAINIRTWQWGTNTQVSSAAIGNVTGGTSLDIVTVGEYFDGTNWIARMVVWNGATLAVENIRTWLSGLTNNAVSVAVGNSARHDPPHKISIK